MSLSNPSPADRIVDRHWVLGTDIHGRVHHADRGHGGNYVQGTGGAVFVVDPDDGIVDKRDLTDQHLTGYALSVHENLGWEECNLVGARGLMADAGALPGGVD